MANCFACLKSKTKVARDVKLVIIGLDDAGKTTTVACLQGEPPDGITPTVGFSNANLTIASCNVTLYDLGGGINVRTVWKKYFADIYGIIFTVDSGNKERLIESKEALQEIFQDPKASGKPIVVFANKQDKDGALDVSTIKETLNLQNFSDKHGFKFNIFPCSALKGFGKKTDKSIKDGFDWLLKEINDNYAKLHEKVERESKIQKELEAKERKEKWERIRKQREEREKAAKEAGINDGEDEENEDDGDVMGGPFRNITDQIKITEKREKKEKENRKKIKEYLDNKQEDDDDEEEEETSTHTKKTAKPKKKKGKKKTKIVDNDDVDGDDGEENGKSSKIHGSRDSGLSESFEELDRSKLKKKGKKKKKPVDEEDDDEENNFSKSNNKKKRQYQVNGGDSDRENDGDNYGDRDNVRGGHGNKNNVILVNSSEDFNEIDDRKRRPKPKPKKESNVSEGEDNDTDREEEAKTSKEKVNDSRVELFRARSSDMLQQSAESYGSNSTKKGGKKKGSAAKKKKKKGKNDESDECEEVEEESSNHQSSEGSNKKTKKKKKKKDKINKTEPNNHCLSTDSSSVDTLFAATPSGNGRQSWNSKLPPIRENGHSSKLEPIELRGRLPDIGNPPRSNGQAW